MWSRSETFFIVLKDVDSDGTQEGSLLYRGVWYQGDVLEDIAWSRWTEWGPVVVLGVGSLENTLRFLIWETKLNPLDSGHQQCSWSRGCYVVEGRGRGNVEWGSQEVKGPQAHRSGPGPLWPHWNRLCAPRLGLCSHPGKSALWGWSVAHATPFWSISAQAASLTWVKDCIFPGISTATTWHACPWAWSL